MSVPGHPHPNGGGSHFVGTVGDDTQPGTNDSDSFDYSQGGNDTLSGLDGNDIFLFGATFNTSDHVDGGANHDILILDGDYSGSASEWSSSNLNSVEEIRVTRGHSYFLFLGDSVATTASVETIDGHTLGANDTLDVDCSLETNGQYFIFGGKGDDDFLIGAGADHVLGNGGDDFIFAEDIVSLTSKTLDGGKGNDTLSTHMTDDTTLNFEAASLKNIERFDATFDGSLGAKALNISTNDANVGTGQTMAFFNTAPGATTLSVTFNGTAETDGHFLIGGGAGNDFLLGGAQSDTFDLSYGGGGEDEVFGNAGDDLILVGGSFDANDLLIGDAGTDTLELNGDYESFLALNPNTISGIEKIVLDPGHIYTFALNDGNVAAGDSLTIDASHLGAADAFAAYGGAESDGQLTFLGGKDSDEFTGGSFSNTMYGGAGNDDLTGGAGADDLNGGGGDDRLIGLGGSDRLTGGNGVDWLLTGSVADSTGTGHDKLVGFDADADKIGIVSDHAVDSVDAMVAHGTLGNSHFDANLHAAIGSGQLAKHHAVLFTPDKGALAGTTFLIVDGNNHAGYQADGDFVFLLTDAVHLNHLDAGDFMLFV